MKTLILLHMEINPLKRRTVYDFFDELFLTIYRYFQIYLVTFKIELFEFSRLQFIL